MSEIKKVGAIGFHDPKVKPEVLAKLKEVGFLVEKLEDEEDTDSDIEEYALYMEVDSPVGFGMSAAALLGIKPKKKKVSQYDIDGPMAKKKRAAKVEFTDTMTARLIELYGKGTKPRAIANELHIDDVGAVHRKIGKLKTRGLIPKGGAGGA